MLLLNVHNLQSTNGMFFGLSNKHLLYACLSFTSVAVLKHPDPPKNVMENGCIWVTIPGYSVSLRECQGGNSNSQPYLIHSQKHRENEQMHTYLLWLRLLSTLLQYRTEVQQLHWSALSPQLRQSMQYILYKSKNLWKTKQTTKPQTKQNTILQNKTPPKVLLLASLPQVVLSCNKLVLKHNDHNI